ncbi:MAG: phage minor head protein [Sporomusaceae bacterium]|nr:phage minor head protein [Sporomusaceae bacterium]
MKPDNWQAKRHIESEYDRALRRLLQRSWQIIGYDPELMNPWDLVRRLERLSGTGSFQQFSAALARRMVTQTFYDTAATWRQAAQEGSQGRLILQAMRNELQGPVGAEVQQLIARNAGIIRSLPISLADQVTQYIHAETLKGKRHDQIARELLSQFPRLAASKAALIARTESSKAHTALIQVRSGSIGAYWYEWRTSKDGRVRSSHAHMDGVLIRFDTPPAPEQLAGIRSALGQYNAGEAPNCRCYPKPVIFIDYVTWPHRVYYGGRIVRMSREQFQQIAA